MATSARFLPLSALVATTLFTAGAHAAAVMTFDPIASWSFQSFESYSEAGFMVTSVTNSFVSWGSSNPEYNGSQALFLNHGDGVTVLSRVGGGSFSFDSVDLSELYRQSSYAATNVTFIGELIGGGTASFSVDLDLVFGNQNVDFGSIFGDVTSVSWAQTYNYHQFDNLVMDSGSGVPEPTSLALVALALAGLGMRRGCGLAAGR